MRTLALVLVTCLTLSGCGGWHLRGQGEKTIVGTSVFIRQTNSYYVWQAFITEISNRGAGITSTAASADLIVEISGQRFTRRILSIDPDTGKVREIEVALQTEFGVRAHDGTLLIPRETVTWNLDYVFDEGAVLGTTEQDVLVQRDLAAIAATAMALQVAALDVPAR